jgi:hypothetical protein
MKNVVESGRQRPLHNMRYYPSTEIGVPEETHTVRVTVVDVSAEVVPPFDTLSLGSTSGIFTS